MGLRYQTVPTKADAAAIKTATVTAHDRGVNDIHATGLYCPRPAWP